MVAKSEQLDEIYQVTDLELLDDGGVILVGLKYYPVSDDCHGNDCTSILGHLMKLDS